MKTITVTVSDNYYNTFMEFFKYNPNVSFDEKEFNNWQEEMVLERIKNAKPEDYIDTNLALINLKEKYGLSS
jgi:serine protease inhibitor